MLIPKILIVHPKSSAEIKALKDYMEALNVKFEVFDINPYNSQFVSKILKSKQEFKEGDFVGVKKKDLKKYLGLK